MESRIRWLWSQSRGSSPRWLWIAWGTASCPVSRWTKRAIHLWRNFLCRMLRWTRLGTSPSQILCTARSSSSFMLLCLQQGRSRELLESLMAACWAAYRLLGLLPALCGRSPSRTTTRLVSLAGSVQTGRFAYGRSSNLDTILFSSSLILWAARRRRRRPGKISRSSFLRLQSGRPSHCRSNSCQTGFLSQSGCRQKESTSSEGTL
mmetsp:Transcript_31351/g.50412  ORF Transcript_31351/g.50412 Transcript_31351/m.50412 type:complete len:206 (-) Transcript_31351:868-1485(-)